MLKAIVRCAFDQDDDHLAFSPSTYVNIWNSSVKGNFIGGTKPYYYDSILVIGTDEKILHQQILKDTSKDKFDVAAIVAATKKALA